MIKPSKTISQKNPKRILSFKQFLTVKYPEEVLIGGQRDSTDAVEATSKLDARLKSITETDPYQWSFSKGIMFSNITRLHSCYVEQLLTVAR